jgi:adenosylcobinamide-phosphate synthase
MRAYHRGWEGFVFTVLTLAALLIEAAFGYPQFLFRCIAHPVTWIGALIQRLDDAFKDRTRGRGVAALSLLLAATILPSIVLQSTLPWPLVALLAASLPAQRSLWRHVADVAQGLESGLEGGRIAVARIVGRDPQSLDAAAVARAAIESLAENFSDGVVAPALWCLIAGLPGIAAYKAINTADSMIGHRTPRHEAIGWAAARLDDLVNLPASRLSAFWLILAAALHPGASAMAALRAVWRDARHHRSPNAGWPEAAMAGALGLRLAGPRNYHGVAVTDGWMGDGRATAAPRDIRRALNLYCLACLCQIAGLGTLLAASLG